MVKLLFGEQIFCLPACNLAEILSYLAYCKKQYETAFINIFQTHENFNSKKIIMHKNEIISKNWKRETGTIGWRKYIGQLAKSHPPTCTWTRS